MDVVDEVKFFKKASDYIKYIQKLILSKDKISLYYGTNNLTIGVEYPIDPIHCIRNKENPSVFEFGIGFYLSPNLDTALGYTYGSLTNNMDNFDEYIDGDSKKFNIHSYEIDLSLENLNIDKCLYIHQFEGELEKTIHGYQNEMYYNKDVDVTIGLMCGKFWDNNIMSYPHFMSNPKFKNSTNIKTFVADCIDSMTLIENNNGKEDIPIQYCIHKDEELLSNHKYCEFTSKDILEMYFSLISTGDIEKKNLFENIILKINKEGVGAL